METVLNEGESVSITTKPDAGDEVAKAFKRARRTARRTFYRFTCKNDLICRVTGTEVRGAEQICQYCGLPRSPGHSAMIESKLGELTKPHSG